MVRWQGVDSSTSAVWWTPAKVNLFLAVLAKRSDGYHDLETLMAAVSVCDTLVFKPLPRKEIDVTCEWAAGIAAQRVALQRAGGAAGEGGPWDALPDGEQNLVWRALTLLQQRSRAEQGAQVRLVKRIPAAAGLGGASSDAAAALVAANQGWNLGWSNERLAELAAEVGSDVPFFLCGQPAVCRGRGERIEPLKLPGGMPLVIVRPPVGLSTPEVFRHCRAGSEAPPVKTLSRALRCGDRFKVQRGMTNQLQSPAERLSPEITRLTAALKRQGGAGHMTGSGSSCFLMANSVRHARRLATRLRAEGWQAVYPAVTRDRMEPG